MSGAVSLWEQLAPAHSFLSAIAAALVTSFILWFFRSKVKLIWGSTSSNFHNFKSYPDGKEAHISTEKFFVQNVGRRPAREIELVFSSLMTSYNVWPPRQHNCRLLENGNFVIHVPSMAPRELLIVDTVDVEMRTPTLLAVNCPEALSREVRFEATRKLSWPVNALLLYLLVAGLVGSFYFLIQLLVN